MYLIILHIIMYTVMYYKFELKRKTEKKNDTHENLEDLHWLGLTWWTLNYFDMATWLAVF